MKVLDLELDKNPTPAKVRDMAELRIRNLLCFDELNTFNNTGKWLYKHPFIIHQSERQILIDLRKSDPKEFLKQYAATEANIKRYTSFLKSDKRKDQRITDKKNLARHIERAQLFKSILEDDKNN